MQNPKFATPEINLLPADDDLESRPGGKFLKWALSWGKKIVVLTELIVVMAFLSRFWLDSQVANQSEDIQRRKTIISASGEFEKQFRATQNLVAQVKKVNSLPSTILIYDSAKALIPQTITITKISVNDLKVSVEGSGDDRSVSSLVALFKNSPDFESVILDHVSKQSPNSEVSFSLTAIYTHKNNS